MTEKSRVISRANVTNIHISTVGYDSTIQTEVDICEENQVLIKCRVPMNHSLSGVRMVRGRL